MLSPHAAAAAVAADDVASCPLPPFRSCAVVSAAVAISVAVAAVVARRPPQKLRASSMRPQLAATAAAAAASICPALCSWFLCRWSALCVAALVVFLAGAARLQELSMLAALIQKLYSCSIALVVQALVVLLAGATVAGAVFVRRRSGCGRVADIIFLDWQCVAGEGGSGVIR